MAEGVAAAALNFRGMKRTVLALTMAVTSLVWAQPDSARGNERYDHQHSSSSWVRVAEAPTTDVAVAGPLKLGMSAAQVKKALGQPESHTQPAFVHATGAYDKTWNYPKLGLKLTLSGESANGKFDLGTVVLTAPSSFKVAGGLQVGMPQAKAAAYVKSLQKPGMSAYGGGSPENFGVLQESTYTVLSVECAGGVVKQIYLGPGPE